MDARTCAATLLVTFASLSNAAPSYEAPAWRTDDVLPALEQQGPSFHVLDPVTSDGIMPQYRIESRDGVMTAYGHAQLQVRLHEISALEALRDTSELDVVADTTRRQVENTLKTVAEVARDPLGTVGGLPRGIVNLFKGATAQLREFSRGAERAARTDKSKREHGTARSDAEKAQSAAQRYAERYLGINSSERGFYERLALDPYTDNTALRQAIRHLAQVEAATSLGLRLASLPSIPYASDVQKVMNAVYHEDPAVLREQRRAALVGYGLSERQIEAFEEASAMSPTRQLRLAEAAAALDGVSNRAELFRRAAQLESADEAELYVRSTELMRRLHRQHPLSQLLPNLPLPAATYRDRGGVAVVAAAEGVYWTPLTDKGERSVHQRLAGTSAPFELWIEGYVSDTAMAALQARGWSVQRYGFDDLP